MMKNPEPTTSQAQTSLNSEMIELFDERGWIKIQLGLDNALVEKVLQDLKFVRAEAVRTGYPARRIYYDHLFDTNLASIELPYNDATCPESVKVFFQEAKIGAIVCQLMGWDSTVNTLSRLFTMGKYNYRGQWHRDYLADISKNDTSSLRKSRIQAGIYFEHQAGFRILKKEYDRGGRFSIFDENDNYHLETRVSGIPLPVKISSHMFDVIQAEPGAIVLFDPYLYHQGSCNGSRLDFHLRFDDSAKIDEPTTRNHFQDFDVIDCLGSSFDLRNLVNTKIPSSPRQSIRTRIINSANYLVPVYNCYLRLKNSSKLAALPSDFSADLFSNNIFQAK